MLRDFVGQQVTPPGTDTTIILGAALAGFRAFSASGAFTNGQQAFYYLSDGSQWESGIATLATGSPDSLTGRTPITNSAGTTARLNFTGTCYAYNSLPSLKAIYMNGSGAASVAGAFGAASVTTGALGCTSISLSGAFAALQGNGISFSTFPALLIGQSGATATTAVNLNLSNTASNFLGFQYNGANIGSITTNGSSVTYNTTSDYRLKTVHGPASVGDIIDAVPVHQAEMQFDGPRPMFLAHELQAYAPWAVSGTKDAISEVGIVSDEAGREIAAGLPEPGELPDGHTWRPTGEVPLYQQVDHTKLIPVLWAEIKALRQRVAALEAR